MYISHNWLKDYLPKLEKYSIKEISDKLSGALAEVEEVIERGVGLENIVAGEIKEVEDHPKNEKLAVAKVDTGDKVRNIIFAAKNKELVKVGSFYPVCLPGGKMFDASKIFSDMPLKEIEQKELDGEVSEGVLCSPKELGVADIMEGISIIGEVSEPGKDLLPLLQDKILEIENKSLTHRPDCFCHRGIARELSAILNIDFLDKRIPTLQPKLGDTEVKVDVKDKENCKRFSGIAMQNVKVGTAPSWMQIRLSYVGTRPINSIVDISNYVMFDIGYPSHMYDLDKIEKNTLIVRKAKKGEKVKALNEKTYDLDTNVTIIADKNGVEDIAGIMGGANSEISTKTENIFIESAVWDMFNIRKSSMRLGLTSEASNRYSKGLSSAGTLDAVNVLTSMIQDIAQAEISSDLVDIQNKLDGEKELEFDLKSVARLIGLDVSKDEILNILTRLEIQVTNSEMTSANVNASSTQLVKLIIPAHRKDLNIEQDIVEEIARIYGYDKVSPKLPTKSIKSAVVNPDLKTIRFVRDTLSKTGLSEVLSYGFVDKALYEKAGMDIKKCISIKNPLSSELTHMRNYVLPSIIGMVEKNINNYDNFSLFEISKVAKKEKRTDENIPFQPRQIAGLVYSKSNQDGFFSLKSSLETLLSKLNAGKSEYIALENSKTKDEILNVFHPYKSAEIKLNSEHVGFIGNINPIIQNNFKYDGNISIFQLDYEYVKALYLESELEIKSVDNNQIISRDIGFWMEEKTELGKLIEKLKELEIEHLTNVTLVDIYTNDKGKSAATVRLRFEVDEQKQNLLTDKEIKVLVKQAEEALVKDGFKVR